jgi:hypothetical protein
MNYEVFLGEKIYTQWQPIELDKYFLELIHGTRIPEFVIKHGRKFDGLSCLVELQSPAIRISFKKKVSPERFTNNPFYAFTNPLSQRLTLEMPDLRFYLRTFLEANIAYTAEGIPNRLNLNYKIISEKHPETTILNHKDASFQSTQELLDNLRELQEIIFRTLPK